MSLAKPIRSETRMPASRNEGSVCFGSSSAAPQVVILVTVIPLALLFLPVLIGSMLSHGWAIAAPALGFIAFLIAKMLPELLAPYKAELDSRKLVAKSCFKTVEIPYSEIRSISRHAMFPERVLVEHSSGTVLITFGFFGQRGIGDQKSCMPILDELRMRVSPDKFVGNIDDMNSLSVARILPFILLLCFILVAMSKMK